MKTKIPLQWLGVLSLVLLRASMCAQTSVTFANFGTGWAAPWYSLQGSATTCALRDFVALGYAPTGNAMLSGTGFTAELWAGPEGSTEASFQRVSGTTFRTGTSAGLLAVQPAAPVPFAAPAQRIQYQLRVWENQFGTITSWGQVMANPTVMRGATPSYLSPPLTAVPITLEFSESFVVFPYMATRAPLLAVSWDRCEWYTSGTVHLGEDVHLGVAYPNPVTNVQWSFNGVLLPNETNHILSLSQVQVDHTGTYTAVASTPLGSRLARMTNSMLITVLPAPRLTQLRLNSGLVFNVEGTTNRWIRTERSTDLRSWSLGPTQFVRSFQNTVTIPPPLPQAQFHRIRTLP